MEFWKNWSFIGELIDICWSLRSFNFISSSGLDIGEYCIERKLPQCEKPWMIAETWKFIHELNHVAIENIEKKCEKSKDQELVVAWQMGEIKAKKFHLHWLAICSCFIIWNIGFTLHFHLLSFVLLWFGFCWLRFLIWNCCWKFWSVWLLLNKNYLFLWIAKHDSRFWVRAFKMLC